MTDSQTGGCDLSVVVPTYNEAERLGANIAALRNALELLGRSWELVVVNDGSTDGSGAIVEDAAGKDKRITVVGYPVNRGRGYALTKGIEAARGTSIITTESDVSYGTAIIGQLLQRLEETGADIVVASPYMPGGRLKNVPLKRAFLSRWGNFFIRHAISAQIHTITGMTRGYRASSIKRLALVSTGKEIHLEIISKALAMGYVVEEIPAELCWEPPRAGTRKRRSTFRPGRYIASHLLFSFGESPLLLFGTVGIVFLVLGSGIGLYALGLSLAGIAVGGRPIVVGAALFILFGVQIFLFCFLAIQNRELRNKLVRIEAAMKSLAHGQGPPSS